ncbi:hypothetical protein BDZ91DRAFT_718351 [Kalaharituber pfeilii]|nr:hypothetical protein BDZ91DRAFT_718351 [Kalaharituber pfeilii]
MMHPLFPSTWGWRARAVSFNEPVPDITAVGRRFFVALPGGGFCFYDLLGSILRVNISSR